MPLGKRRAASQKLAGRLRRLPEYKKARWVLFYLALSDEVETRPMIERALGDGKRVAVPITLTTSRILKIVEITGLKTGLNIGPHGIEQPARMRRGRRVDLKKLDLIVVPGVAFDAQGRRLGRGGGYFDRLLARLSPDVPRVGLAFRCQRVKRLPSEPHDLPVHRVLAA